MRIMMMFGVLSAVALIAFCFGQAQAACLNPPASEQAIGQFTSNPKALVAPDADTRIIEATTRDLVGTNAALAANFVQLAKATEPRFQIAIAAGLAQAAIACTTVDQEAALLIQQAVAGFQDEGFQAAFAAVAGDLSTAATGAATASTAGSAGSVAVTNPNRSRGSIVMSGGGGAVSALVQLTAPGVTFLTTETTNSASTSASATAADAVSATQ
jgi:hypothetical protein